MATILHSLVVSCAKKLQDIILEEAILILGVKEELRELLQTVNQIQCFLNDAEQRRREESAVNNWLSELKDSMYEADDIIDMAKFEGRKLLTNYHSSTPSSSRNSTGCIRTSFFSCIPSFQRRREIAIRIRSFTAELEKIAKLGERFLKLWNMGPKEDVSTVRKMKTCKFWSPTLWERKLHVPVQELWNWCLHTRRIEPIFLVLLGQEGLVQQLWLKWYIMMTK
jgi:hypothetical protein